LLRSPMDIRLTGPLPPCGCVSRIRSARSCSTTAINSTNCYRLCLATAIDVGLCLIAFYLLLPLRTEVVVRAPLSPACSSEISPESSWGCSRG
jgi:hypothetical protein